MNVETEIIKAIDYSDNEEYQKAIDVCNEIIKVQPDYDRAYFERGVAYWNLYQDQLAGDDFKHLLKLNPEYPGVKDWYAKTLAKLGNLKTSADLKLEALRENPDGKFGMGVSPQSWAECAEAYYKAGDLEKAEAVLTEYFSEYKNKVDKYINYETTPSRVLIKILFDEKKVKQALEVATDAMQSQYKVPKDYELFIEALILNGQLEKAREEIKNYVDKIQGGYENDNILRLKDLIENQK